MTRLQVLVTMVLLLAAGLVISSQVRAVEESVVLTESQIKQITVNCEQSKYQLEQLHASDALIRVNIGQEYANLSSRLMAPLNSRIALNGLDGVKLSQITVDYNHAVRQFQQRYLTYEASLSSAIKTDCQSKPIEYYSYIKDARRLRAKVNQSVVDMNRLVSEYERSFDKFANNILTEAK